ncbi:MAG: DNA topoisomerase 4 subunit A [Lentisphaeria bacterium]|nr:DNA topoisomerase 4 subunit A [Lentisphaeria bacterium]
MADNSKTTINAEEWGAIQRTDVTTEVNSLMRNAYLQYSVSANVGRAIPDVRDGLKPGARRILYAMLRGGYTFAGGLNKCAKVVGLVIGNYHPHGDTAVYDTIVRMAQDFSMRVPLIIGHGNFGSMDGDGAAAYRYTECKMDKAGEALLADLDKETVDMRDTFDGKELEPIVLPAAFPNLLVNGSQGIGVGMATNVPTHNMGEAIDAAVALIDNPDITVDELMQVMPGPDFPTGGIIHGTKGVRQLYATGQGGIRVRGKTEVVFSENGGPTKIVVTEIPYGVNKADMVGKIGELAEDGVIHGVRSVNDYSSSRAGVKIEITLKQDAVPNVVLNEIFHNTPLEITYPAQFLVVDHNRPRTMTLKQILEAYVDHREQVVTRRTQYLLKKALERDHIVEGLLTAQANIDDVIHVIRSSKDRLAAQKELMARFVLDEAQTSAILDMRLSSLTNLEVDKLTTEHADLQAKIAKYREILSCRDNIMAVVKQELLETKGKFFSPRRTLIESNSGEADLDGLTKREIYVVTHSKMGYIKRCCEDVYEAHGRGGTGVIGMKAKKEGDAVQIVLSTRSHNTLLFFTNYGRVYRLRRAYELPEGGRTDSGRFIHNVLSLIHDDTNATANEEVRAIISYDENDPAVSEKFVVIATRKGMIKRMRLDFFQHVLKNGKRMMTYREEGDDIIDAQITNGSNQIILSTDAGRAVRFVETKVRDMGAAAAGVFGIRLRPWADGTASCVVAMTVVDPEDDLMVITAKGMGKRTPIGEEVALPTDDNAADNTDASEPEEIEEPDESEDVEEADDAVDNNVVIKDHYRLTNRGSQGVISVKLREGDRVIAALQVSPQSDMDVLMLSCQGQAVRTPVAQVKRVRRTSHGVIVMRFSKTNDSIANVSLVDKLSEEDSAANEAKIAAEESSAAQAAAFNAQRSAQEAALAAEEEERQRKLQEAAENGEEQGAPESEN